MRKNPIRGHAQAGELFVTESCGRESSGLFRLSHPGVTPLRGFAGPGAGCADEPAEGLVDLADRETCAVDDGHCGHRRGAAGHSELAPIFHTATAPAPASRAV